MSTPLLSAAALDVGFDEKVLLRDVSLSLASGRATALPGPSGCGKTTLLRTLAGLVDPLNGRVELHDAGGSEADGSRGAWWPKRRRRVVYVQQHAVMLDGSVEENLARAFGYRSADDGGDAENGWPRKRAIGLFERLRLEKNRLSERAAQLSVGQRQRVALVRALLVDPVVLLLDEPTAGLDDAAAEAVWALLRDEMHDEQRPHPLTLLVATHDAAAIDGRFDAVIDLRPHMVDREQPEKHHA